VQSLFAVISMPLDPIIVRLGGLAIHWYGLFIALGILVNVPLARRECKRKGISEDLVFNLAVWCVIFGVIGGRLYYVVQADQPGGFSYYLDHPGEILATWEGGMAFYGMVFAVFLTVIGYCYWSRKGQRLLWQLLDMAAIFLPLGQAFGRLGNVVNGDIVGYPSNLPWAIVYPNANALAPDHTTAFQPASIYELLFSLALFGFLWWARTRVKAPGLLFATYTFLYSAGQFVIFYGRANSITILDLKQAQVTALAVMLAVLPLTAYLLRRYERVGGELAVETPVGAPLASAVESAPVASEPTPARQRRPRRPASATAEAPVALASTPDADATSDDVEPAADEAPKAPRARRAKPKTAPLA
jgi:phosphatidylglycerol:prolipoprotein diacylglycerol transferase